MPTDPSSSSPRDTRIDTRLWWIAMTLLLGGLAPLLDTTIVNVALDTLARDLHAGVAVIQWVPTAFLLAMGIAISLSSWTVTRFGGKPVWLLALAVFLAGSVLAGTAWSVASLIGFRVLQGLGAGLIVTTMQALLAKEAGSQRLGRMLALISIPALAGPIFGPALGGLIVDQLGWRYMFFINVPLCLLALTLALRHIPADQPVDVRRPLDLVGLALLAPAITAIFLGIVFVGTGHKLTSLPSFILGAALLVVFVIHARRAGQHPLIDMQPFRVRSFSAATALLFLTGLSLYGAMLLLPLFYIQLRGQTALAAGLLLAPYGIGGLFSRVWAGTRTDRVGARSVVLPGILLAIAGTVPFALAGPHTSRALLLAALTVRGFGLGAVTIPAMATVFIGLSSSQIPHASTISRMLQQLGGAFGAAFIAIILQAQIAAQSPGPVGLATAYHHTFWWSIGLTLLAVLPATLLPHHQAATHNN